MCNITSLDMLLEHTSIFGYSHINTKPSKDFFALGARVFWISSFSGEPFRAASTSDMNLTLPSVYSMSCVTGSKWPREKISLVICFLDYSYTFFEILWDYSYFYGIILFLWDYSLRWYSCTCGFSGHNYGEMFKIKTEGWISATHFETRNENLSN